MRPTPPCACAGTGAVTLLAIVAFCVITLGSGAPAAPADPHAAAVSVAWLRPAGVLP